MCGKFRLSASLNLTVNSAFVSQNMFDVNEYQRHLADLTTVVAKSGPLIRSPDNTVLICAIVHGLLARLID